jgi:hypothetical protein
MFAVRSIRAPLARVAIRAAPVARFSALSVRFGESRLPTSHSSHPSDLFYRQRIFIYKPDRGRLFYAIIPLGNTEVNFDGDENNNHHRRSAGINVVD